MTTNKNLLQRIYNKNAQTRSFRHYHMEAWWGWDTVGGTLWDSPSCHTSPARLPLRSRNRSTRVCVCPLAAASASSASAWRSWLSPPSPSPLHSGSNITKRAASDTASKSLDCSQDWFEEVNVLTVGCTPRNPEQLSDPQLQDVLLLPTQWRL